MSVKLEKMRAADYQKTKLSGADLQKLAIMKEVLYDQHQLQQVLAKSDSMMAVVKDLFGDDPKRSVGIPNITTAPQSESVSSSLVQPIADFHTRSEKLSASVMSQSAINDIEISDSEEEDGAMDRPGPISYQSKLDLKRFQNYLQEEERKSDHINPVTLVSGQNFNASNNASGSLLNETESVDPSQLISLLAQGKLNPEIFSQNTQNLAALLSSLSDIKPPSDFKTPPRNGQPLQPPPVNGASPAAMNDTQKVNKTKKKISSSPPPQENSNLTMTDMRQALKDLEGELASYEHQTGKVPKGEANKTDSFSGYTVALVSAVSRLTRHLKEMDLRVRTETTLREQLTQDVYQLRAIIDALAGDLIMTQEEYAKLYSENQRYRETTASELESMKKQIMDLQSVVAGQLPKESSGAFPVHHFLRDEEDQDGGNTSHKSQESRTSTPNLIHSARSNEVASSSSAVLLSPVVRKTRVCSNTNQLGMDAKRQTSLVEITSMSASNSGSSNDPPRLTQAPPVMTSISVPRPISLVQSNLSVPLTSSLPTSTTVTGSVASDNGGGNNGDRSSDVTGQAAKPKDQRHQLEELSLDEVLENPVWQDLMQSQIAELNRQQEEARNRLKDLLANQKFQQEQLQQHLQENIDLEGSNSSVGFQHQPNQQSVSPPISPISSPPSEQRVLREMDNIPQIPYSKGITLTLPMAELDVSGGSLNQDTTLDG